MPTVAVPTHVQPARPHGAGAPAPVAQQPAPAPSPAPDLPWSSVTRIGGQQPVNGRPEGDDAT
jgi:hypothetical protein